MKKILQGLWGTVNYGEFSFKGQKTYENLRQALVEFSNDERYEVHYWDFRKYSQTAAERAKREGQSYTPEKKGHFYNNIDIASPGIIISLEYDVKNQKRAIYVREFPYFTREWDYLIEVRTPTEIKTGRDKNDHFLAGSGTYVSDGKIYYLLSLHGLNNGYMENDVFGYHKHISDYFDRKSPSL